MIDRVLSIVAISVKCVDALIAWYTFYRSSIAGRTCCTNDNAAFVCLYCSCLDKSVRRVTGIANNCVDERHLVSSCKDDSK